MLATVSRDGVIESIHRGRLAIATAGAQSGASFVGQTGTALGHAAASVYLRSSAKPFQALATLALLDEGGIVLDTDGLAIACASHVGSDEQQIEAARLLALADLDESALQCPKALPTHVPTLLDQRRPTRLAHNCSGKHAGFLLAQVSAGDDPARYRAAESRLQRLVREMLVEVCEAEVAGPGRDGCGAPAWRLPLSGLATGFAKLAAASSGNLASVRDAMRARPDLIRGSGGTDTELMLADARVVAKSGAEAVLAAGLTTAHGAYGVAVKIADGGTRATGPVVAAVLQQLGANVPDAVLAPPVLGGGRHHGEIRATAEVDTTAAAAV